jgi:F-box-like
MSITNLPVEILTHICDILDLKDWCSLRLACKTLYNGSIEAFANRYYKSVSFFITSDGLRRVEQIAAHDFLRTRVQELWIAPVLFDKVHRGHQFDKSGKSVQSRLHEKQIKENAKVEARYVIWEDLVAENRELFESSTLVDFLERCMTRFENVVTVGLRRGGSISGIINPTKDFEFHCLGGEDIRAQLHPLGEHTIFLRPEMTLCGQTILLSILIKAMIQCKRKIQTLYADSLRPEVFQTLYKQQELLHFRGLTTLKLTLHFRRWDDQNSAGYQAISDFIQVVAPTLRSLTFSQWQSQYELGPNGFDQLSQRVEFSHLHKLHLHYIEVTVSSLKSFLRTASPTLRKLTLESVCLCDKITSGNDPGPNDRNSRLYSDLSSEAKNEIRGFWQDLLQVFREQLSLHSLTLNRLGYRGRALSVIDGSKHSTHEPIFLTRDEKISAFFDADKSHVSFDTWIRLLSVDFELTRVIYSLPGSNHAGKQLA